MLVLNNETVFYDTIRLINEAGRADKISISGYNDRFSIDNDTTGSSITIKKINNKAKAIADPAIIAIFNQLFLKSISLTRVANKE